MKLCYRFVCSIVAVIIVLFSVRVSDVDADVVVDDKTYKGFLDDFTYDSFFYDLYDYYRDSIFESENYKDFSGFCYTDSSNTYDYYYIFGVFSQNSGSFSDSYFVPIYDEVSGLYNFTTTGNYYNTENSRCYLYLLKLTHNKNTGSVQYWSTTSVEEGYYYNSNFDKLYWDPITKLSNIDSFKSSHAATIKDISSYQLTPFGDAWDGIFKKLTFTVNPDFYMNMDLSDLSETFSINVENETDNYYNYCIYISESPASSGVQKSFSDAVYILSSTQWCMKFSWKSSVPDSDENLLDWIKSNFSKIYDTWGNIFNPDSSYVGRHGGGSSSDGLFYYALSQQNNCPFYLIKPNDSRTHVIPYSSLNLSLDTIYYLNIIYLDTTDYGVVSASSWGADLHNFYRDHPLYNLNLLNNFSVYSSTDFSVHSGNFTKSDDVIYDYKNVVDNSNPSASSATISSDDNSVSINNSNSYDNSSSVSYINYGMIYHNCTWGSSSGAGGSRPSVPDLPDADFEDLYDQSGNFFDFVADVLDAVGAVPMLFITAAFAVLLFLRIWGR